MSTTITVTPWQPPTQPGAVDVHATRNGHTHLIGEVHRAGDTWHVYSLRFGSRDVPTREAGIAWLTDQLEQARSDTRNPE